VLTAAANTLIRALLAPCCAACDRPLNDPLSGAICASCWDQWPLLTPPMCARCGDQLAMWKAHERLHERPHERPTEDRWCERCRRGETSISRIRSAGVYDGTLRHMVHALKYRKRRMIAPKLAERMRRDCTEALSGADAVVPVPLHWLKQWDRGFNQADDIAMHLGLPVWRALRRKRSGPPQASLPAFRRHGNAHGAYALAPIESLRGFRGRPRLLGASLVLVDDVVTTGATLEACAQVLLAAGAARVTAVTAARAVAAQRPQPLSAPRLSLVRRR
jgi:ComF family protein